MAAFNKFNSFITAMAAGTHSACLNADTDTLKIFLTNSAPHAVNDSLYADLTDLSTTGGYTVGGEDTLNAATTTTGTISVACGAVSTDITWTASGAAIDQFQWVVLYNSTETGGPLIGWWENPVAVDLADGDSFTVNFGTEMFTVS